ncbi:DUF1700 domain-containing protein [Lentilactobacillus kribbianus]|uniref:DUF1700 domain-containing protein n=1 Tax=Lentilactobacillus kribbianus TaxID=2729622 RepID=UPI001556E47E|nr:hypothetical protein [Lentilactobacillus kribbianus]
MANDVTEYLAELKGLLGSLTTQEQDDVMEFYSEYLQDAGVVTRSEVESRLGTHKQLARKVLADYSIKDSQKQARENKSTIKDQKATNKSNVTMIWMVILAIASSPVTIPLALGVLLVLAGAILAVLGVLFAAIVGVLGVGAIALFAIYVGIMMIPGHLAVALFYLGAGVAAIGALLIGVPLALSILSWLIKMTALAISWLYRKITKIQPTVKKEDHHEKVD